MAHEHDLCAKVVIFCAKKIDLADNDMKWIDRLAGTMGAYIKYWTTWGGSGAVTVTTAFNFHLQRHFNHPLDFDKWLTTVTLDFNRYKRWEEEEFAQFDELHKLAGDLCVQNSKVFPISSIPITLYDYAWWLSTTHIIDFNPGRVKIDSHYSRVQKTITNQRRYISKCNRIWAIRSNWNSRAKPPPREGDKRTFF